MGNTNYKNNPSKWQHRTIRRTSWVNALFFAHHQSGMIRLTEPYRVVVNGAMTFLSLFFLSEEKCVRT